MCGEKSSLVQNRKTLEYTREQLISLSTLSNFPGAVTFMRPQYIQGDFQIKYVYYFAMNRIGTLSFKLQGKRTLKIIFQIYIQAIS